MSENNVTNQPEKLKELHDEEMSTVTGGVKERKEKELPLIKT